MVTTENSSTARSERAAAERNRVLAGLVEGTVETAADLRVRGSAEEVADDLREVHLPALEEAGYIEWDRDAGTIEPGPNFDEVADHVEDLPFPDGGTDDD